MRTYVTYVSKQHLQVSRMKFFIVAMLALVAGASTGHVKREIGISSGYGGAFGYTPAPISIKENKYLKSDAAPKTIDSQTKLSTVSFYNYGVYDHPSKPADNVNKDLPASLPISNGYGGAYGYIPTPNVVIPKKTILSSLAIASGYGGAYGYGLPTSAVDVSNGFKFDVTKLNGYGFTLPNSAVNVKSESLPGIISSSSYGGEYGYAPIPKIIIMNFDVQSDDAISSSNKGDYLPEFTINDNEQNTEMLQEMEAGKVVSFPQLMLDYLPGYSGYGARISSDSGYSRYPDYIGYGFAYANGWL